MAAPFGWSGGGVWGDILRRRGGSCGKTGGATVGLVGADLQN